MKQGSPRDIDGMGVEIFIEDVVAAVRESRKGEKDPGAMDSHRNCIPQTAVV